MSPETHEGELYAISIIGMAIFFIGFLKAFLFGVEGYSDLILLFGPFILTPAVALLFIYLAPVRCDKDGCEGRMHPIWKRQKAFFALCWRLSYRCNSCEDEFVSNFTFSFGGSANW